MSSPDNIILIPQFEGCKDCKWHQQAQEVLGNLRRQQIIPKSASIDCTPVNDYHAVIRAVAQVEPIGPKHHPQTEVDLVMAKLDCIIRKRIYAEEIQDRTNRGYANTPESSTPSAPQGPWSR